MRKIWIKIDNFLNVASKYLLWAIILFLLWAACHKRIEGRQMMYEDYYNQHNK